MTSPDLNDLMHTQEKLEWVTPKISLMYATDNQGVKGVCCALETVKTTARSASGSILIPIVMLTMSPS